MINAINQRFLESLGIAQDGYSARWSLQTEEIIIECRSRKHYDDLLARRCEIDSDAILRLGCSGVRVRYADLEFFRSSEALNLGASMIPILCPRSGSGILEIPSQQILYRMIEEDADLKIIRHSDGVGLATGSNCCHSSGISPEEWLGRQMNQSLPNGESTWLADEWAKYNYLLLDKISIENHSYLARFFTGQLARFTVDARLGTYGGSVVRVVRTRSVEVLEVLG